MNLTLALSENDYGHLQLGLSRLLEAPTSELRVDLPSGWTLYFKLRSGESRQFLAHPEHNEWVATLALSETHLKSLLEKMKARSSVAFSELEEIHSMSNVDIELKLKVDA